MTPEGLITDFLAVTAPYEPPSPNRMSPALWGSEDHVRELFDKRVEFVELSRRHYCERAANAFEYAQFYKDTFGPIAVLIEDLRGAGLSLNTTTYRPDVERYLVSARPD